MGNAFAGHSASGTLVYLQSKETGKFWQSSSKEGEGFRFSSKRSPGWILEKVSGGSVITLKSVAHGGYLHNNMEEDDDEGLSFGSQDEEEARWRIEADIAGATLTTSGMTVHLSSCAEDGQFMHSNSEEGGSVSWGDRDSSHAWALYFDGGGAATAPPPTPTPPPPPQRQAQRQAPHAISADEIDIDSLVESLRAEASAFRKGAELGRGGCIVYAGTFKPTGMTAVAIKEFVKRDSLEECEDEVRTTIAANAACSWGTPRLYGWQQSKSKALVAMEVAGGVEVGGGERALDLEGFIGADGGTRCTSTGAKLLVLQRTAKIMRCLHQHRINHGDLDLGQILMMGADPSELSRFASSPTGGEDADAAEIAAMRLADWGGGGVGAADAELYGDFHAYIVQFVRALFMNPEEEEGVCDYDKILAHSRTEGDFDEHGRSIDTINPLQVRTVAEMVSLPHGRDTVGGVRAAEISPITSKDEGEECECTFTILLPSGVEVKSSSGEFIDRVWDCVLQLLADAIANETETGATAPFYQTMEVTVPAGVVVGQQFLILTPSGQQMQVSCPVGAGAGGTIRVQVPT